MPSNPSDHELTRALQLAARGGGGAGADLLPLVYQQLRAMAESRLARRQPGQTLQATALVHEAWLRLEGHGDASWNDRAHFFGAASRAMRNILVEQARRRAVVGKERMATGAPGPAAPELETPVADVVALNEALERMEEKHPLMAQIVTLRFFGGLSMDEVAQIAEVSARTAARHWALARAWLRREVDGAGAV